MEAGLLVEALTLAYRVEGRRNIVVADADLRLAPGEVVGLAGESGCGKSTLALSITGYRARAVEFIAGSVRLGGEDLLRATPQQLRATWGSRIAFVAQTAAGAL